MAFYEKLTALRKDRGLSQEMLAEKIGVSRQAVSKWELGETTPDLNKMVLLADVFDVSLDNLCGRQETMRNVQANQKEGRKHWPIISLILVVVILLLGGIGLRSSDGNDDDYSAAVHVNIVRSTFYSGNGYKLRYEIVPEKLSSDDTYELLITPETPVSGAPEPVKLDGSTGVFDGELAVPLTASTWTVSLRVSRGEEECIIPVAMKLHYSIVQNTLTWQNVRDE